MINPKLFNEKRSWRCMVEFTETLQMLQINENGRSVHTNL